MPDRVSHSSSWLPTEDRQLIEFDLYLKIATQIKHFFEYDLNNFPLEMEGKILRVEFEISGLDPLNWLAKQTSDVKTYWVDRSAGYTTAGVGIVEIVEGNLLSGSQIDYLAVFDELRSHLSPVFPRVRYYGGVGFNQDRSIDPIWQLFGNYRFIVPRFEIWTDGIETHFACNFKVDNLVEQPRQLELILQELSELDLVQLPVESSIEEPSNLDIPLVVDRVDCPNHTDWHKNIDLALSKFSQLNLDKIVLARRSTLTFTASLKPESILIALKANNPLSYHFCFQINSTTAFIGASPERLYHRQDRFLQTEAVAGTRHRGISIQIDRELSDNLQNSPKDIHEHQLVVQNLQDTLAELCDSVTIDRHSKILKLNKVQHLYTQCQGILKPNISDADILSKLHPTPAVGGFPKYQALELIQQIEPFERGWYAAPVGWVGYDQAEFAVAIRSGLIDRNQLLLFAGAGIVRGSQSEEEWAEIETKICHFTDLFIHQSVT